MAARAQILHRLCTNSFSPNILKAGMKKITKAYRANTTGVCYAFGSLGSKASAGRQRKQPPPTTPEGERAKKIMPATQ
jgi:hypothetical protein